MKHYFNFDVKDHQDEPRRMIVCFGGVFVSSPFNSALARVGSDGRAPEDSGGDTAVTSSTTTTVCDEREHRICINNNNIKHRNGVGRA